MTSSSAATEAYRSDIIREYVKADLYYQTLDVNTVEEEAVYTVMWHWNYHNSSGLKHRYFSAKLSGLCTWWRLQPLPRYRHHSALWTPRACGANHCEIMERKLWSTHQSWMQKLNIFCLSNWLLFLTSVSINFVLELQFWQKGDVQILQSISTPALNSNKNYTTIQLDNYNLSNFKIILGAWNKRREFSNEIMCSLHTYDAEKVVDSL